MDVIKSIKKFFFNENDNENKTKIIDNKNNKDFPNEYYKIIFKLNYRNKKNLNKDGNVIDKTFITLFKQKEENQCNLKIKVNKCNNNNNQHNIHSFIKDNKKEKIIKKTTLSPINKSKLNLNENYINSNIGFFYILKGAVIIIEEWWKKILIRKRNNKIIIKRSINNKNHELFSQKYIFKSKDNSINYKNNININNNYINNKIKPINKILKNRNNISQNNNNILTLQNKYKYFKTANSLKIAPKMNLNESIDKENYQKDSYLEDTVNNFDSFYYEFSDNKKNENAIINKEKEKIKKIMKFDEEIRKRKIYSSDKIYDNKNNNIIDNEKDNIETKRESSIIYPMNEIEHLVIEDICSNLDNHLKKKIEKEKNLVNYYNLAKNKIVKNKTNKINDSSENKNNKEKENELNKISIPWEDPNNNMTPFISIEQNKELFNEIKSKIKVNLKKINDENESEISIMQNKYLLRENPFNDSSIYIKNSDIKQNELIRNVNIHIIPTKTKEIINLEKLKDKKLNNSNNSNTIINTEDEDNSFSKLISISDTKNDGHTSSFFNSIKNDTIDKEKRKIIQEENDKKAKKDSILRYSKKKFENIYKN